MNEARRGPAEKNSAIVRARCNLGGNPFAARRRRRRTGKWFFHRTKWAIIIVDVNDEQDSGLLLLLLLLLSNLRGLLLPFFTVIWLEIVDFRGKKKMLLFLAFLGQRAVMDPSAVKLTARARGARHSLVNSKLD